MSIKKIISLAYVFLLWGCSVSKYIPQGESLYTGAKVNVNADSSFSEKQKKIINKQLVTIIRPVPNKTIFGFPYKVWLYYVLGEPKNRKSPRRWFRDKFGEPPVLASKRAVNTNTEIISNFLNNEGYFRSTATGELIVNGKKANAIYNANVMPRYSINSVQFIHKDSSTFQKNLQLTQENSLLKINQPYRFENVKIERERIDRALKLKGYYFFRPDFLIIKVDSNQNTQKVNLYLELKPNVLQTSLKQYRIKNIFVYVDTQDSTRGSIRTKRGIRVFDPKNAYNDRVFNDAISFNTNRLYSSQTHDASLSRLINLRNFKFVKNRFELVNRSDSAFINVVYDLTSLKNKSFQAEFDALTRSNNLAGTLLGVNWSNRNIFRGAEILKIGVNGGFDFQLGGKINNNANSYYRLSGDADLTFPRFLLPFYKIQKTARNQALPKTNINVGYERLIQNGVGLREDSTSYKYKQYTITSLRSSLSYSWRKNAEVEHNLTPLSINLIKPKNISEEFVTKILSSNNSQDLLRYLKILETRLILGGQYNIIYTPKQPFSSRQYFYINAGVDIAGNIAGLFANKKKENSKQLFNILYEQYVRFDTEMRYYLDLTPNLRLANRLILGYGIPYGNSISLPYQVKQYFVGGSNSIRAFRARSLGPGSFNIAADSLSIFTNAYGDIKLEMNSELRIKVTQLINFAAFIDAGNVWSAKFNGNSFYTEDGVFGKDFYKQIAVGGGLGLRLDFGYFKLRLDLATPFRKPWLPEKERWVLNKIDPFTKSWRKENLILNIAVDYPF